MLTLKTLWNKAHAFLRNDRPRDEWFNGSTPHTHKWAPELFDEERDPWYTHVYWFVRRNGKTLWDLPHDTHRKLKFAYQRLTRGWDDRVVWSVDWWMNGIMPDILRQLKEDKHGIPSSMFDGLPTKPDNEWEHTPEAWEIATKRWNDILDKMIAGFEANQRMKDMIYEDELGAYPLHRPVGVSRDAWEKIGEDHFTKSRLLAERDQKIFEEGIKLFAEYYNDLWD
jgi:hypothetical protein